jgi:uncharacterized protein (TIGR02147 family)
MRAFARALGMSHTLLSLILAGKRSLTRDSVLRICEIVPMTTQQRNSLLRSETQKSRMSPAMRARATLQLDQFEFISDWHHYAILSLLETKDSKWNAKWISKRLGIPEVQASIAMDRLDRLGIVGNVGGKWKQTTAPLQVDSAISTPATRKHHHQLIDKAQQSLENDSVDHRDFSGITFAMDPRMLPLARERIRKFRRELTEELENLGEVSEVYELSIQCFPLSQVRSAPGVRKDTQDA